MRSSTDPTVEDFQDCFTPTTRTGINQSRGWNLFSQPGSVDVGTPDDNRNVDGVKQAALAGRLGNTDRHDMPIVGIAVQGCQRSDALGLVCDTRRMMEALVSEAAVAKAAKSTAYAAVCGGFRVSHAEGFVILSQFCEPRLRQGEAVFARHVLYRHDAEANHWAFMSAGDLMQRFGNLVVWLAEIEDVIALDIASSSRAIDKIAMRDEQATAVLADERMLKVEITLDQLHFRPCLITPQHDGDAAIFELADYVSRCCPVVTTVPEGVGIDEKHKPTARRRFEPVSPMADPQSRSQST
jgi:hypothetical protein